MWVLSKWNFGRSKTMEVVSLFVNQPTVVEVENNSGVRIITNKDVVDLFRDGCLRFNDGESGISLQEISVTKNQKDRILEGIHDGCIVTFSDNSEAVVKVIERSFWPPRPDFILSVYLAFDGGTSPHHYMMNGKSSISSLTQDIISYREPSTKKPDKIDIVKIEVGDKLVIGNGIIGKFSSWMRYAADNYTAIMRHGLSLSGLRRDGTSNLKDGYSINEVIKK